MDSLTSLPGLGDLPVAHSQGVLLGAERVSRVVEGAVPNPVATVHVVMPQPHMDRTFDYLVPESWDADAVCGARVEVELAGQRQHGFIVSRGSTTDTGARLRPIRRVIGLPVLRSPIYEAARDLARERAGSVGDILQLAVPQRHARTEREWRAQPVVPSPRDLSDDSWSAYPEGSAFLRHVASGDAPSALLHIPPGADLAALCASAVAAARRGSRGVIVIVPTAREVEPLAAALERSAGEPVVRLVGSEPPAQRYLAFLDVLGGNARIAVGTRSVAWAPVDKLGLAIVVDEASGHHVERRSPYHHSLDVVRARARHENFAVLRLTATITPEAIAEAEAGGVVLVEPSKRIRGEVPHVSRAEEWDRSHEAWARLPESAFLLVREALARGPVLVVVPRAGYIPLVACAGCGTIAECPSCRGRLELTIGAQTPTCTRCGSAASQWTCPTCGNRSTRSARIGSHRTAEEIGRAFPHTPVQIVGGGEAPVHWIASKPKIVVATPGSEPRAEGGFAAALVLDARFLQGSGPGSDVAYVRAITRVAERVRGSARGGHVMCVGGADAEVVRCVATWGHAEWARQVLEERRALYLPPTTQWLGITGRPRDVVSYISRVVSVACEELGDVVVPTSWEDPLLSGGVVPLPAGIELLGPVPGSSADTVTAFLRCAAPLGAHAGRALREYSAAKAGASLRVEINPQV